MYSVQQIADKINGIVDGNPNLTILGVCDLKNSIKEHITFFSDRKYLEHLYNCKASAIIVNSNIKIQKNKKTLIKVKNPAYEFISVIKMFYAKSKIKKTIHNSSTISKNAKIGKNVYIGPNVFIGDHVIIHNNVSIGANSVINESSVLGEGCLLHSNITIYNDVEIGSNCIIESGSAIGSDGFGLVKYDNKFHKIPHIGKVIIKNDVWIGTNCCIDRGTLNDTVIDEGTKIDNLVHIAHNVNIGKNCILAAQVGIAGSTIVEDDVTIAGQVGIIGHLTIGSGSTIASKSAVFKSLPSNSFVSGIPAKKHKDRIKQDVAISKLPDILYRIRSLEKK
tara:strand:- start:1026 stop:2030 length:1005 start_codon:yes stop_codon:yes gene_type:complete